MVSLTEAKFVGYAVPELFGSSNLDSVVSQVFRLKIFVSLVLLFYSLFFIFLYSIEENYRRFKLLFRGISIPVFLSLVVFWQKFVNDDHIVTKHEKTELFTVTIFSLMISILLFAYSFRSPKRVLVYSKSSRVTQKKDDKKPDDLLDVSSSLDKPLNNDSSSENDSTPLPIKDEPSSDTNKDEEIIKSDEGVKIDQMKSEKEKSELVEESNSSDNAKVDLTNTSNEEETPSIQKRTEDNVLPVDEETKDTQAKNQDIQKTDQALGFESETENISLDLQPNDSDLSQIDLNLTKPEDKLDTKETA